MLVLALDTSTPVVTAGVVRVLLPHQIADGSDSVQPVTLLDEQRVTNAVGHAEHLMPLVRKALVRAQVGFTDLDAVVVGLGPGPFTGLRVGIATAAALGDGLQRPAYGVCSHDGLIASIDSPAAPTLVVTDARRREVYVSAYSAAGSRVRGPVVLPPAQLPELIAELQHPPQAVAGPGVGLIELDLPVVPLGSVSLGLVRSVAAALVTGAIPGPLTPMYLRRPDVTMATGIKSVLR